MSAQGDDPLEPPRNRPRVAGSGASFPRGFLFVPAQGDDPRNRLDEAAGDDGSRAVMPAGTLSRT
ncbi:hypothetical protein GCM10009530_56270 [Microbispora corallina]|uniref:Uncharacterized protein n=1 Tax=Microbispora corallina TaxID=83302 RepID=A0ABQ4G940_9ACTN|nr:hypothetical protein Mco01_65510 [Microbispora corallina]